MNKMIVAVFDSETKAHEGLSALKNLHNAGDVTLYASAVIGKDAGGKMKTLTVQDEGPVGMATGFFTGGLLGLLGGSVGALLGATTGSVLGLLFDAGRGGVNEEFADDVSNALTAGKTAVIAEVEEEWTIPVDNALEPLGGVVFRRDRYEVADEQAERESKAMAAEYQTLKAEWKDANDERKAKINARIDSLRAKAKTASEALDKRIKDSQEELNGKVAKIQGQMKTAGEKRQAKLQRRIDDLKADYAIRSAKLKQASALAKEALSMKAEAEPA